MNDLSDLSPPAAAAQRATEAGHGVLAVGRPWVQFEGWVLKESGALTGGWHLRYFVVSGDRLEYFREEKVKLEPKPGESASTFLASLSLDQTNVVCIANSNASPPPKERQLQEGDVIIGINGEPCVGRPAGETLAEALSSGPATCVVLRPKGRIALHGATAVSGGPRKGGGHMLTVSVNDSSSRRSKYNLVCADERLCAGWIASIKEAIAASAMEEIKTALSQALSLRALQETPGLEPEAPPLQPQRPASPAVPPRPSSAGPKVGTPRRSASYNSNLSSLEEARVRYWTIDKQQQSSVRSRSSSGASDKQFEV